MAAIDEDQRRDRLPVRFRPFLQAPRDQVCRAHLFLVSNAKRGNGSCRSGKACRLAVTVEVDEGKFVEPQTIPDLIACMALAKREAVGREDSPEVLQVRVEQLHI